METKIRECGGAVVVNKDGNILVANRFGHTWTFPKGHIDPGEDALAAAERETKEETGVSDLTLIKELGSCARHKIGKEGKGEDTSVLKRYTYFLFTTDQMELAPEDDTHPEARWVPREKVTGMLTHPKDAAFFECVVDQLPKA